MASDDGESRWKRKNAAIGIDFGLESVEENEKEEPKTTDGDKRPEDIPIFGLENAEPASVRKEEGEVVGLKKLEEEPAAQGSKVKKGWPYSGASDGSGLSEGLAGMIEASQGGEDDMPKTLEQINAQRKKRQ